MIWSGKLVRDREDLNVFPLLRIMILFINYHSGSVLYDLTQRASALFFIAQMEGERMAKDGTARGGARVGAGRRPKALADKIALGRPAEVICRDSNR